MRARSIIISKEDPGALARATGAKESGNEILKQIPAAAQAA
jgi:hypothetical protein